MMRTKTHAIVAGGALALLSPVTAATAQQCANVPNAAGIELMITVEGVPGQYRLTCRNGALVAVPDEAAELGGTPTMGQRMSESVARTAGEIVDAPKTGADASSDTKASKDDAGAEPPVEAAIEKTAKTAAQAIKDDANLDTVPEALESEGGASKPAGPTGAEASAAIQDQGSTSAEGAIEDSASEAASEIKSGSDLDSVPEPLKEGEESSQSSAKSAPKAAANNAAEVIEKSAAEAADDLQGKTRLDSVPENLSQEDARSDGQGGTGPSAPREDETDPAETAANLAGVSGQSPSNGKGDTASPEIPNDVPEVATVDRATGTTDEPPVVSPNMVGEAPMTSEPGGNREDQRSSTQSSDDRPDQPVTPDRQAQTDAQADMVAVPLAVIASAELALPGADFEAVSIRGDDADRVYALRGTTWDGTPVSVTVQADGRVTRVDRRVDPGAVPGPIRRIAEALLPGAAIKRVLLSSRDNYSSYFVYEGTDERSQPFALEIRSDGRSVQFKRAS
ncbi:MAG: hypothetical protein KAG89_04565 [Fulvimarina manganoxydans]|uniref:hypothetical protein n=1 Tax=Fulvimarina manganoxydans TaxID=937218 RepID=UPI0023556E92|nr:hypothetical protein [Fulvimarina manganoxydans]MCK5931425.1 hypothetical protein [Fulvimarina manganoxydans]